MNGEKSKKILILIVLIIGGGMFYFSNTPLPLGSYNLLLNYLLGIVIVVIAIGYFLKYPDVSKIKILITDGSILILPYLVLLFFSMIIWIIQLSEFRVITRGAATIVYQCLGLLVAMAYIVLFGKKAPVIQAISMIVAELVLIFNSVIRTSGVGGAIREYVNFVISFGENKSDGFGIVEKNEVCFAFAVYLIFFIVKKGRIKYRFLFILLTAFCIGAAFKRITVIGVVASIGLTFCVNLLSEKKSKQVIKWIQYLFIVGAILYIVIIKEGIFNAVTEMLQIDTKSRSEIVEYVNSYYFFGPSFVGYGLGYVARWFQTVLSEVQGVAAIHNDFLRIYIEAGFWGFLVWLWTFFKTKFAYFCKKRSKSTCLVLFAVTLYSSITYLTDNTCFYFYTNLAIFTIALSCVYEEIENDRGFKENENSFYK